MLSRAMIPALTVVTALTVALALTSGQDKSTETKDVDKLLELLNDPNVLVRREAARSLAESDKVSNTEVFLALCEARMDLDPVVRTTALRGIAAVGKDKLPSAKT